MKNKTIYIVITAILFGAIILLLIFNMDQQTIICPDLPHDSAEFEDEIRTNSYRIIEEINDEGDSSIFISSLDDDVKIKFYSDPLIVEEPIINYNTIKVDGNIIYYSTDDPIGGSCIIKYDINKYTFDKLYQAKGRTESVTLFNVPLITKTNSAEVAYSDKINDFILAGDRIILIKGLSVTVFDGKNERILVDNSIRTYKYKERVFSYEDYIGEYHECNIDD